MHSATILYLVVEDFLFVSHFLDRARAAKAAGWRVVIAARESGAAAIVRDAGMEFVPLQFKRRGANPFDEIATILNIVAIYRDVQPHLVHHIALKPIIYGTIAAVLARTRAVVNAPIGLGFTFSSTRLSARILRSIVLLLLRWTLNPPRSRVIFENTEDRDRFVALGFLHSGDSVVIEGAGVDLEQFHPRPEPPGPPIVLLAARMLAPKGIRELVEAANLLHRRGIEARVQLAGNPDPGNPESISEEELRGWSASGVVEWLGHCPDMAAVYGAAHIACLPSYYGEGLPKTLLEALATGLPIVTTDSVGCRAAVTDGDNGILVPPRDPRALADALGKLVVDRGLRSRFGAAGRRRAELRFGSALIVRQTLAVYDELHRVTPPDPN